MFPHFRQRWRVPPPGW